MYVSFCLSPVVTLVLLEPSGQDEEIRKIQAAVTAGMTENASHLQAYLKTWDKYRDIWETNKDSFIQRYQKFNLPVTTFDSDVLRHGAVKTVNLDLNLKCADLFILSFFLVHPQVQRKGQQR